jgi:hypothetical protein
MKTIRTNCFETNSSSTHSVTIDSTTGKISEKQIKGSKIYPGEFGWEWRKLNRFVSKASYFWTLVADYPRDVSDLKERLERLAEKHGFELMPTDPELNGGYSYVDHGWEHYEKFISQYPELDTDDGLFEFLTSTNGWIMLGNDNGHSEPNFRLTPHQIENATSYLVLNTDPPLRYAMVGSMTEEDYAVEAVYTWRERSEDRSKRYDDGWIKILEVSNGEVKCVIEKYDYKTSTPTVIKEFTLTYTIEHNAKYIAPSL